MIVNFTTQNIDKKLYEKSILTYIYDHYLFTDHKRIMEQDKWEINIRTLKDFKWNFYDKEIKNLSKKGTLDHDDTWGKAGDVRNFFSTEIHNRVANGKTRKFTTWHKSNEYYFYGIDIEDLTNKRNLNNGI